MSNMLIQTMDALRNLLKVEDGVLIEDEVKSLLSAFDACKKQRDRYKEALMKSEEYLHREAGQYAYEALRLIKQALKEEE